MSCAEQSPHIALQFISELRLLVAIPADPAPWQRICIQAMERVSSVTIVVGAALRSGGQRHLAESDTAFDAVVWLDGKPPAAILKLPHRLGVWTLRTDFGEDFVYGMVNRRERLKGDPTYRAHVISTMVEGEFVLRSAAMRVRKLSRRTHMKRSLDALPSLLANAVAQLVSAKTGTISLPRFNPLPEHQMDRRMLMLVVGASAIERVWKALFRHEVWRIGLVRQDLQTLVQRKALSGVVWLDLKIRRSAIVADPFVVSDADGPVILCELMDYAERPSKLVSIHQDGSINPIEGDLRHSTHLSYPFVIVHEGRTLCVPETASRGEVALYDVTDLTRPRRVKTLLPDFPGIDPTVFCHGGRWWMCCTKAGETVLEDLHLFHSERLFGSWTAHPRNPVITDISCARPAGPIVLLDGHLCRLGQDCRRSYGDGIDIRRIVRLDPEGYREESFSRIAPEKGGPYPFGVHTISPGPGFVVVDGKRKAFVAAEFRRAIRAGLSRFGLRPRRRS